MTFEEKTIESEYIYKGAILNLRRDKVNVINGTSYREIIEHNGGAAIVAMKDDRSVIMVKQYRKAPEEVMLEVPAGKRDDDEAPEEVAVRELKEETGYTANSIIPLGRMHPTPGYSQEVLYLFLAQDLIPGETNFDDNEAIDICEYPLDELVDMIMSGEIKDGKTQVALLMTAEYLRRSK